MMKRKLRLAFIAIALAFAFTGFSSFLDAPPVDVVDPGDGGGGATHWDPFLCRAYGSSWPSCKIPNNAGPCDRVVWCADNWPF